MAAHDVPLTYRTPQHYLPWLESPKAEVFIYWVRVKSLGFESPAKVAEVQQAGTRFGSVTINFGRDGIILYLSGRS
jgi:hypothetical protein